MTNPKYLSQNEGFVSVALVSDTHGYLDERIAELIKTCDYAVHAGDICRAQVLAGMKPKTGIVITVRGNNDNEQKWLAEELAVVSQIPYVAQLELPGGLLIVEHGDRHGFNSPCHAALRAHHPQARVIVYGHSHKQLCDQSQTPWVVNPGAAGRERTHGGPACLILIASVHHWEIGTYRFEALAA